MSDHRSTLSELASFIGGSSLNSEDMAVRRRAIDNLTAGIKPRPSQRRVSDLLGVVLTLSARSRRSALPAVNIDLDVFGPNGQRAVRIQQA